MQHSMFNVAFDRCNGSEDSCSLFTAWREQVTPAFSSPAVVPQGDVLSPGEPHVQLENIMSIELALLRRVETLVQKRITRLERRVSYLHLSPALLKDIGLEGHNVQVAHIREREFQTGFRLGNRIT